MRVPTKQILPGLATAEVSASSVLPLSGAATVLLSTTFTTATGRFSVDAGAQGTLGAFLVGSNGWAIELRLDGVLIFTTAAQHEWTVTVLSLTLSQDADWLSFHHLATGQTIGSHLVELIGFKLGGVSTASATGNRYLIVKDEL